METTYLILGFFAGGIIGAVIAYLVLKSSTVSRNSYENLNHLLIRSTTDLENSNQKISDLNQAIHTEKENSLQQSDLVNDLKNEFAKISAEYSSLQLQSAESKELQKKQITQIDFLLNEKQEVYAKNSELSAINEQLKKSLTTQKDEISKIQEEGKLQFENLANKILEEKTEKFTILNQKGVLAI